METKQLTQSEKISLGTKEIARLVRQQLKTEYLNSKFSVRTEYFAGGSAIHLNLMATDIQVIRSPEDISEDDIFRLDYDLENIKKRQSEKYHQLNQYVLKEDYQKDRWCNGVFLTEEGHKMLQRVVQIVEQYNYNNSDSMTDYFDVNFYCHYSIGKWDKPFEEIKNGN